MHKTRLPQTDTCDSLILKHPPCLHSQFGRDSGILLARDTLNLACFTSNCTLQASDKYRQEWVETGP